MQFIIVLEYLFRQTSKAKVDATIVKKVNDEIQTLNRLQKQGYGKITDYLINQNGKPLVGRENLWKYQLTAGDRIVYTYGKYLKWMPIEYQDSLVIVAYSKHDNQSFEGSQKRQEFYFADRIQEIFGKLVECDDNEKLVITDDDIKVIHELLHEGFNKDHSAYVINPNSVQDPSLHDVILSKEQDKYINEYIKEQHPIYVRGGAGTGKTIMAIHIMKDYRSANPNKKIAYFTQSDELMNKINSNYNYIYAASHDNDKDSKTDFINLNTYCRKKNEILDKNFIKTDEFMNWINSENDLLKDIRKQKIELLPLWAEIRGVIKGALDDKWCRTQPKNRLEYDKEIIDELNDKNLLIWKDGKKFVVDPDRKYKSNDWNNEKTKDAYEELQDYFKSVDINMKAIRKEDYLNISTERSVLAPEHREFAYSIYQKYQDWLNRHKYVDENDLIIKTISNISEDDKYDLVVIDEVQDYTELQIWFLNKLVKNNSHFVMAGDSHQNINPTVFNESRLGMFLRDELEIKQLSENFRCQKEIVQYANGLAKIRSHYIGKTKGELEETSKKRETNIKHVMKLDYSKDNVNALVKKISQYPDAAILVANKSEKEKLIKYLPTDKSGINNIFTIAEIKGMEYQYVVCANVVSSYKEIWKTIYETTEAKKQSRFRYYFNMFYVGLTRAQETLVILEENEYSKFYEDLQQKSNAKFYSVPSFDEEELNISQLSNNLENSFSQAQKYEEQGLYEQAIALYTRANAEDVNIVRCQMKLYAKNKDYINALRIALLLNDDEAIENYAYECDEDDKENDVYLLAYIYLHPESLLDNQDWEHVSVEKLIKETLDNDEDMDNLNRFFVKKIDTKIGELIKGDESND